MFPTHDTQPGFSHIINKCIIFHIAHMLKEDTFFGALFLNLGLYFTDPVIHSAGLDANALLHSLLIALQGGLPFHLYYGCFWHRCLLFHLYLASFLSVTQIAAKLSS